jgi:hypothetical protein
MDPVIRLVLRIRHKGRHPKKKLDPNEAVKGSSFFSSLAVVSSLLLLLLTKKGRIA